MRPTYIRFRIDDQVAFYRNGVRRRERRVQALRWLMLGFGGLGTLLAVAGLQLWVAVTVAVVGALTTYLEAMQLEATIMLYNQAATNLEGIRAWWTALPPDQQVLRRNVDRLVERSERVMQAEHGGWVQEMQDAMTRLHLEEIDEAPAGGGSADEAPAADGTTEKRQARPRAVRSVGAVRGPVVGRQHGPRPSRSSGRARPSGCGSRRPGCCRIR